MLRPQRREKTDVRAPTMLVTTNSVRTDDVADVTADVTVIPVTAAFT